MDYVSPEGFHRHECQDCGIVWEHSDATIFMPCDVCWKEHCCPGCGVRETFKYKGPKEPTPRPDPNSSHGENQ